MFLSNYQINYNDVDIRILSSNIDDANDVDDFSYRNTKTRLLGTFGVGTFILLFLLLLNVFVYYFSYSCNPRPKSISRLVVFLALIITAVILWFAPKTSKYTSTAFEPNHYDHSIIPRIAISLLMIIFSFVAGFFYVGHIAETTQLSTIDHDHIGLWQED